MSRLWAILSVLGLAVAISWLGGVNGQQGDPGSGAVLPRNSANAPSSDLLTAAQGLPTTALALTTTTTIRPTTTTLPAATTTATPTTTLPPTTTTAVSTTLPPTTTTSAAVGGSRSVDEAAFVTAINDLRTSLGVAALTVDGGLSLYARNWSMYMATSGDFSHSDIGSLLGPWNAVAENIAYGGDVPSMFGGLSGSSGHYQNMTNATYTHVGVGVVVGSDGRLWTTHVFGG